MVTSRLQLQPITTTPNITFATHRITNVNFAVSNIMITFAHRITISNLQLHGHCFAPQTVS